MGSGEQPETGSGPWRTIRLASFGSPPGSRTRRRRTGSRIPNRQRLQPTPRGGPEGAGAAPIRPRRSALRRHRGPGGCRTPWIGSGVSIARIESGRSDRGVQGNEELVVFLCGSQGATDRDTAERTGRARMALRCARCRDSARVRHWVLSRRRPTGSVAVSPLGPSRRR